MTRRKKRRRVNVSRLRKAVAVNNRIYGLLLQAHDALRGDVIELETRVITLEKRAGLKWLHGPAEVSGGGAMSGYAIRSLVERNALACEQARRPVCVCRCGGKLHGKAHGAEWVEDQVELIVAVIEHVTRTEAERAQLQQLVLEFDL